MGDAAPPAARLAKATGIMAAALLAGCVTVAGQQGNPAAPIVVSGKVIDATRSPIAGATLDLSVSDIERAAPDGTVPVIYHEVFTSGRDGTFAIHLAPTQQLVAFARLHGGVLQFDVLARSPAFGLAQGYSFARDLAGMAWGGDVPFMVFTPSGVEAAGAQPGVTVAKPAST